MNAVRNSFYGWGLVVLTLILMVGCVKKEDANFVLTASSLPEALNGSSAFLLNTNKEVIGQAAIENGAFEYRAKADPEALFLLALGEQSNIVVPEMVLQGRGELYTRKITPTVMEPDKDTEYDIRWSGESGSELNLELQAFRQELAKEVAPLEAKLNEIGYDRLWKKDQPEVVDSLDREYDRIAQEAEQLHHQITSDYASRHTDDAVGIVVFDEVGYRGEADYVQKYESAGKVVQSDPKLKQKYDSYLVIVETSEGHPFKDATMDDGEGTQAKLSDYRTDGAYLLIDFWASWCGPCRKAMPVLANLYEKYGDKGLRILSVGVSEESKEANEQAVREVGITWDHFYDASSASADAYGVLTIPVVVLIAPDGEILLRGNHADKVEEILSQRIGN